MYNASGSLFIVTGVSTFLTLWLETALRDGIDVACGNASDADLVSEVEFRSFLRGKEILLRWRFRGTPSSLAISVICPKLDFGAITTR